LKKENLSPELISIVESLYGSRFTIEQILEFPRVRGLIREIENAKRSGDFKELKVVFQRVLMGGEP
jgi:hypothetical protein